MLVKNDGKILYFCGSKCQRNMIKLRRDGKATKWTKTYADLKKHA
jgi:large subunit ribosomal protein L24e